MLIRLQLQFSIQNYARSRKKEKFCAQFQQFSPPPPLCLSRPFASIALSADIQCNNAFFLVQFHQYIFTI